jgi:hypothetical protein
MPAPNIIVDQSNSPYPLPAPTATYGTVTVKTGGKLMSQAETTITIQLLKKG